MKYEVFSPFHQCSTLHGQHGTLEDATKCFDRITQRYKGDIPVHPISGKYIHVITAIGKDGQQKEFGNGEIRRARRLGLGPKAVWTKVPGIATFNEIATMYHEALQLIPSMNIDLNGIFDYRNKDKHFWSTNAGIGQALAYAQQAAFTLELSLKALLESQGQLTVLPEREWHTHDLVKLLNLLDNNTKQNLERGWNSLSTTERPFSGSFSEFLISVRTTYTELRYIPELTEANISAHTSNFRSASSVALNAARTSLRSRSSFRIRSEVGEVTSDSGEQVETKIVAGTVKSVDIPDGFDPHSVVRVSIEPEDEEGIVTAMFLKSAVKDYYGIEGTRVMLSGYCTETEPRVLEGPSHLERSAAEPHYSQEYRTLRGSVYNINVQEHNRSRSIVVTLDDETYFTRVPCIFSTGEERARLNGLSLGGKVLISGQAILQNGRPQVLVGPDGVEPVTEDPEV